MHNEGESRIHGGNIDIPDEITNSKNTDDLSVSIFCKHSSVRFGRARPRLLDQARTSMSSTRPLCFAVGILSGLNFD